MHSVKDELFNVRHFSTKEDLRFGYTFNFTQIIRGVTPTEATLAVPR